MPTYGYRCPACGHEYDKFQKINDSTRATCPRCDQPGERLISGGAGIVFKGSGFYETDYKRAGTARAGASSEEGTASKDEGSSEKKPSDADKSKPKQGKGADS